jgi:SAM-dependent methyltransferase
MIILSKVLCVYIRLFDGGDGPYLPVERRYLSTWVPDGARVADIGGGEGKLANGLAARARWVFLVDKEENTVLGGDPGFYSGSLARAAHNRTADNVVPIRSDAVCLPFATSSLDAIVSSQFLEHIDDDAKRNFFKECARALRPGGVLAISTPNGDYIGAHGFWLPRWARRVVPPAWIPRLPRTLRGAWLEQSLDEWERKVGHHGHGCRVVHLREVADQAGFRVEDLRYLHTRLTAFWFQMLLTFPLIFLLALPIVRMLYFIESKMATRDGVNLMMTFSKPGVRQRS